jgi:hypothetical protein
MSLDIAQYSIGKSLFQSGIFLLKLFVYLLFGDSLNKLVLAFLHEGTSRLLRSLNQIGGLIVVAIEL